MEKRRVLESWKEISDYLHRSIRTCQRWEAQFGLPIHRLDDTPTGHVFAYADELDRWLAEKLAAAERRRKKPLIVALITKLATKKWVIVFGALALFIAAVSFFLWRFLFHPPVSLASMASPVAAFFAFDNITRDEALEPWTEALPQLLSLDLLQSQSVKVLYPPPYLVAEKIGILKKEAYFPEDLIRISNKIKADYLITGSLLKSPAEIIIDLYLYDSETIRLVHTLRTVCSSEKDIFWAVDDLSKKIKVALNIPEQVIKNDIDENIVKIATDSPEAWKFYCQGEQLFWGEKYQEAIPWLRKATEIDPGFAQAFFKLYEANRRLDDCCGYAWARNDAFRYGEKASELARRLNITSRGTLIDDYCLHFKKDLNRAVSEYKKLLSAMANFPDLAFPLAQLYWRLEEYDQVIALLEKAKPEAYRNFSNIILWAESFIRKGVLNKAEVFLDDFINRRGQEFFKFPLTASKIFHLREICALNQNKFEEALIFNDRLQSHLPSGEISPNLTKGPIFATQDDFSEAEQEFVAAMERGRDFERFDGYYHLAGLYLTQGKLEEARRQAQLAIEMASKVNNWPLRKRAHFLMAILERLRGHLEAALKESERACPCYKEDDTFLNLETEKTEVSSQDDINCLKYFHLRALLNLELGKIQDFEKQLAEIKQLIEREQYPKLMRLYYHLLGLKELRQKNLNQAIIHFWRALNLLPSPYGHEADIESAQYYYYLAEAYYQAGRYRAALDFYKKVPRFWELRVASGDLYVRSFYRIARIYEYFSQEPGLSETQVKVNKALASQNFHKFIQLWGDADSIFASEVEEAQRRLASLEGK